MNSLRDLLTFFSATVLFLALCALPARSQNPMPSVEPLEEQSLDDQSAEDPDALPESPDAAPSSEEAIVQEGTSVTASPGSSPYTLPDAVTNRWLGRVSVGVARDNGILNGLFPTGSDTHATYTDASASLAYALPKKSSDYLFDYSVSARHYNRFPELDVVTHDLGLSQVVDFGPRTRWRLSYRYSMTPDFASSLVAEALSRKAAFADPVSALDPLPAGAGIQPVQSPSDGLITLRSTQMLNSVSAGLLHALSPRTALAFQAGYSRARFQDRNLFGIDLYTAAATFSRSLTQWTTIGLSYQAGKLDLASAFNRTINHEVGLSVTKQIGRRSVLSIQGGPSLIQMRGQQTISLPSLTADLLDRPSLTRSTSGSVVGWLGSASIASNVSDFGVRIGYKRSVTGIGGLGAASMSQVAAVDVAREIGQRAGISAGISYGQSRMLGIVDPISLNQRGFTAALTRRLTRSLDLTSFFMYTRVSRGFHGPALVNRNLVGVSVGYNFRTLPSGARM